MSEEEKTLWIGIAQNPATEKLFLPALRCMKERQNRLLAYETDAKMVKFRQAMIQAIDTIEALPQRVMESEAEERAEEERQNGRRRIPERDTRIPQWAARWGRKPV